MENIILGSAGWRNKYAGKENILSNFAKANKTNFVIHNKNIGGRKRIIDILSF